MSVKTNTIKLIKPPSGSCVLKDPDNKDYWKAVEHFELGDCLYPFARMIVPFSAEKIKGYQYMSTIGPCRPYPIENLMDMGIDVSQFKETDNRYNCSITEAYLYRCMPVMLFYRDKDQYSDWAGKWFYDYMFDFEWQKDQILPDFAKTGDLPMGPIPEALLGLGYCDFCTVCDGSGTYLDGLILLSNGDMLGVKYWVWYNK